MNKIICGDNLKIMRSMPDSFIDLIYIDPPFATQQVWHGISKPELSYSDKFSEEEYLEFMESRLSEMYRLLKPDGVICVHIDWRMVFQLKRILFKIFDIKKMTDEKFVNEIIWRRNNGHTNTASIRFSRNHDTILILSKSKNKKFNIQYRPYTEKAIKELFYKNDNDGKGKYYGEKFREKEYSKKTVERMKKENLLFTSPNGFPRYKRYLKDCPGTKVDSVWDDIPPIVVNSHGEVTGYPTQKPLRLLQRLIKAFTDEDDLVADFFCGSGTTIDAAQRLNRKWLGVDSNPQAIEVTKNRMYEQHPLEMNAMEQEDGL